MQLGTHKSDSLACLTTSALVCKFPLPHDVKDNLQSTLETKNKLCSMQKSHVRRYSHTAYQHPTKSISILSHSKRADIPIIVALIRSTKKSGDIPSSDDHITHKGFSELIKSILKLYNTGPYNSLSDQDIYNPS